MAKNSLQSTLLLENYGAVSDRIPNYSASTLEFGAFHQDEFIAFFADMRGSTLRAKEIGPENTFLTIHAVIPTMIEVVEAYEGHIVDIPGDGVMSLFKKGQSKKIYWELDNQYLNAECLAVCAAEELLKAFKEVTNPILSEASWF